MHTLAFDFKGKPHTYRAPADWNQLTAVQLIRWAAVVFGNYTEADQLRLAVLILYGIPPKVFRGVKDYYTAQITHTVQFLFCDNRLVKWLLPEFKIGFRRYYGPAYALSNLTADEFFNYTEQLYQKWQKTRHERELNALCAVLYREKRRGEVTNDVRCPVTEAGVASRSKQFEAVNTSVKQAILLNYEGCRRAIIEEFDTVFTAGGSGYTKKGVDLVLTLAGMQLGPYHEAQNINLYKFLEHTARMIEQAEQSKS